MLLQIPDLALFVEALAELERQGALAGVPQKTERLQLGSLGKHALMIVRTRALRQFIPSAPDQGRIKKPAGGGFWSLRNADGADYTFLVM